MSSLSSLKVVAVFEALKGLVAILAASGALLLVHRDFHHLAVLLVEHTHLNPAARYPAIFVEAATHLQNLKLSLVAMGAAGYSVVRFVEAYGLFREAQWAEIFAAISGAFYVPFELAELLKNPGWLGLSILCINLLVVTVVVVALLRKRRATKSKNAEAEY